MFTKREETSFLGTSAESGDQEVVLVLMDGEKEVAALSRPFKPEENHIEVILARNERQHRFALSEVCCVMLVGKPKKLKASQGRDLLEEVETVTGERYRVYVMEPQSIPFGLYGIPSDSSSPFKLLFFPLLGIRKRRQEQPLGQILENKGWVKHAEIEEALKEQKRLKERRVGEIIAEDNNLPQETVEQTIQEAKVDETAPSKFRVGDILVSAGLVTREQVELALSSQQIGKKKRIGTLLVERGLISEEQLLAALATKFRMAFVDLNEVAPTPDALQALPLEIVYRLQVIPVEIRGKQLVVVTSEPTDPAIGDTLKYKTEYDIDLVVATSSQIKEALEKYYGKSELMVEDIIGEMSEGDVRIDEEVIETHLDESDSKIITLVNKVLIDAYKKGVSDVHFEPGPGKRPFRIRYRIDGICHVAHQIPAHYKHAILSRLKIISKLDIAERRKPQSGKILIRYEGKKLEFRVETTPTVGSHEDAVLRILSASKPLPLEEMGFSASNLEQFREVISKPYGMVLCVGPTGCGKTTTLHSALGVINTQDRKIWTAEDPVEITQEGLRQVQVHPKIGFTFQEALRSFLRSDPDVIMIGEMRDEVTAKTAIEASLTGHMVFSTLHTNSAPETVVRLLEMGMDSFTFSDAMLGILAQRLARKLCSECKEPYHPDEEEYNQLVHAYGKKWFDTNKMPAYREELRFMRKVGCEKCGGMGYKGRIAIHELLVGTEKVKQAIKKRATAERLRTIGLQEGMTTLKMDGIEKIFQGITDLEQILQVCI